MKFIAAEDASVVPPDDVVVVVVVVTAVFVENLYWLDGASTRAACDDDGS